MLTAIIDDLTRERAIQKMEDLVDLSRATYMEFAQAPWSRENFLFELPLKWQLSVYSSHESNLVGALLAYKRDTDYGPKTENFFSFIPAVMLKKDFRGKNATTPEGRKLADAMMQRYHEKCIDLGIKESRLGVLPGNISALKLYESFGYRAIGEHTGVDDKKRVVMSLYLG